MKGKRFLQLEPDFINKVRLQLRKGHRSKLLVLQKVLFPTLYRIITNQKKKDQC